MKITEEQTQEMRLMLTFSAFLSEYLLVNYSTPKDTNIGLRGMKYFYFIIDMLYAAKIFYDSPSKRSETDIIDDIIILAFILKDYREPGLPPIPPRLKLNTGQVPEYYTIIDTWMNKQKIDVKWYTSRERFINRIEKTEFSINVNMRRRISRELRREFNL